MQSKPSPDRRHGQDVAYEISADTRQAAQEADACMAFDDWLYESTAPASAPPAANRPTPTQPAATPQAPTPAR
ncbi:MAG: hypothetical protein M3Y12_07065 [Bacteroidota bacterium]|nr:hypothetical protein [Bacteroidota bacterium]